MIINYAGTRKHAHAYSYIKKLSSIPVLSAESIKEANEDFDAIQNLVEYKLMRI